EQAGKIRYALLSAKEESKRAELVHAQFNFRPAFKQRRADSPGNPVEHFDEPFGELIASLGWRCLTALVCHDYSSWYLHVSDPDDGIELSPHSAIDIPSP